MIFHFSRLQQLHQMSTFCDDITHSVDVTSGHKQVLYCGVPLLLHCLFYYSVQVDPDQFAGVPFCFIMIEKISFLQIHFYKHFQ